MSKYAATVTMASATTLLVQVKVELVVRPGGSALADERTRSVGWVLTGCARAGWRTRNMRRSAAE